MFVAVCFLDSSKSISLSSAFVNTFLKLFLKIFSSIFFKLRRPLFRSWGFLSSFAYRILPFSFVFVNTFWQTFLYILHYQLSFGTLLRVFSCFVSLLTLYIGVSPLFVHFCLYVVKLEMNSPRQSLSSSGTIHLIFQCKITTIIIRSYMCSFVVAIPTPIWTRIPFAIYTFKTSAFFSHFSPLPSFNLFHYFLSIYKQ